MALVCAGGCGAGWAVGAFGRVCLAGAVAAPLLGAAVTVASRVRRQAGARAGVALHWAGAVLAGALVPVVAVHGTVDVGVDAGGRAVAGLTADHLTVMLMVLVLGIGALVQSFSLRYLRNDPRSSRFSSGAGVLVASMAVVAASTTLVGLLVGWVLASAGFLVVAGYRPDLPGVGPSVRRAAAAFLVGDGALVAATGIVASRAGNVALIGPSPLSHAAARLGGTGTLVALLVVAAALARCAQGPFSPWLPGTVAAPTPVSALLHAGFVNGGGILLVRLGALASDSAVAMVVAFVLAAATAVGATSVMSQRADVKSELAYSTMGQMGFMVAEVSVGALGAGLVHLVGHALYKATLFLGSGGRIRRPGRTEPEPDRRPTASRVFLAAVAGLTAAAVVLVLSGHRGDGPLAFFVAATAGVGAWSFGAVHQRVPAAFGAGLVAAAGGLYALVAAALVAWVGPGLAPVGSAVLSPWLLLAVAAGAGTVALALRAPVVGPRLRVALIAAGAPAPGAGQRLGTPSPVSLLPPRPAVGVVPVRSVA